MSYRGGDSYRTNSLETQAGNFLEESVRDSLDRNKGIYSGTLVFCLGIGTVGLAVIGSILVHKYPEFFKPLIDYIK